MSYKLSPLLVIEDVQPFLVFVRFNSSLFVKQVPNLIFMKNLPQLLVIKIGSLLCTYNKFSASCCLRTPFLFAEEKNRKGHFFLINRNGTPLYYITCVIIFISKRGSLYFMYKGDPRSICTQKVIKNLNQLKTSLFCNIMSCIIRYCRNLFHWNI